MSDNENYYNTASNSIRKTVRKFRGLVIPIPNFFEWFLSERKGLSMLENECKSDIFLYTTKNEQITINLKMSGEKMRRFQNLLEKLQNKFYIKLGYLKSNIDDLRVFIGFDQNQTKMSENQFIKMFEIPILNIDVYDHDDNVDNNKAFHIYFDDKYYKISGIGWLYALEINCGHLTFTVRNNDFDHMVTIAKEVNQDKRGIGVIWKHIKKTSPPEFEELWDKETKEAIENEQWWFCIWKNETPDRDTPLPTKNQKTAHFERYDIVSKYLDKDRILQLEQITNIDYKMVYDNSDMRNYRTAAARVIDTSGKIYYHV